jgi:hypothetical protein
MIHISCCGERESMQRRHGRHASHKEGWTGRGRRVEKEHAKRYVGESERERGAEAAEEDAPKEAGESRWTAE